MASIFVFIVCACSCFVFRFLHRLSQPKVAGVVIFAPMSLVLLHELFFSWPPAFADWVEGSRNYQWMFIVLLSALIGLATGFLTINYFARNMRKFLEAYHHDRLIDTYPGSRTLSIIAMFLFLTLCGFLLYRGVPPAITNFKKVISGGYAYGAHESMAEQRLALTKGHHFGGTYRGQGVFRWINRVGWTFVAAVSLLRYGTKKSYPNLALAVAALFGSFIFIAGDGTRGPFLWSLVTIMVVLSLHFRIKKTHLINFVAILIVLLVAISLTQKLSGVIGEGGGSQAIIEKLSERIFFGNGSNTNDVVRFIDDGYMEKRYGEIHRNDFAAAIPFVKSDTPFTYEVFLLQNPFLVNERTTFASMTYLGRLYAEGGLCIVLVGYFLIGGVCAGLCPLLKTEKTPENIAFNGMVIMAVGQTPLNGVVYFLMSVFVLGFVMVLFRVMHITLSYSSYRRSVSTQRLSVS
jgi:hypothetical protein